MLQSRFASNKHLKLTGIVAEIIVIVVGCIVVWELEASSEIRSLGHMLLFTKKC